jgi:hypothetical protein
MLQEITSVMLCLHILKMDGWILKALAAIKVLDWLLALNLKSGTEKFEMWLLIKSNVISTSK